MSVRVADRSQGRLQVLVKSAALVDYTYDRVVSEKTFPKSVRWLLPRDIWSAVKDADLCIDLANSIYVETKEDFGRRRELQKRARGYLKVLERMISLAYRKHYVSADRAEYWNGLVQETQSALSAWMRSDKDRYSKL